MSKSIRWTEEQYKEFCARQGTSEETTKTVKPEKEKKKYEDELFPALKENFIPLPRKEFKFHKKRKWRFDFAFVQYKVALEIEGGVWIQGRHTRGSGFVKDMEKYNKATELGWRILRITPDNLTTEETIILIKTTLFRGRIKRNEQD
jgi:very-short-patch-repair endonuclease